MNDESIRKMIESGTVGTAAVASPGNSFDAGALANMLAIVPKVSPFRYFAMTRQNLDRMLRHMGIEAQPSAGVWGCEIGFVEKQQAFSWVFSDRKLWLEYLNSELSEWDLIELAKTGKCRQQEIISLAE